MKKIREPLVAGKFYPDSKNELSVMIEHQALNVTNNFKNSNILGIISPHAGYIFSLKTALQGYFALKNKSIKHVIIIAPSHHYNNFDFSVGNFDFYKTPLGKIKVNKESVKLLLDYHKMQFIPNAHLIEHSLEVQLPILQYYFPEVDIIPIIFGNQTLSNAMELAKILAEVFHNIWKETAVIVSTDLSHYYNSETAMQMDGLLMKYLSDFDISALSKFIAEKKIEACGIGGILTLMTLANQLEYNKIEHLRYSNSGEIFGNYDEVVGYLSSVIYK